MMRRWVAYTCAAALVAAVVLAVMNLRPGHGPVPELRLRDTAGQRFELVSLRHVTWVASVASQRCLEHCPGAMDRLAEVHDGLPAGVSLVTLVLGAEGQWPPRPAAAVGRARWILLQGNASDADDEEALRRFVVEQLGFGAADVAALATGSPAVLLAAVDPTGRPRRPRVLDASGNGARSPVATVLDDAFFLVSLRRHPLLNAGLNATCALLLVTGYVMIRRRLIRAHMTCMIAAATLTAAFLVSYLVYHFHVGSMPFRGTGLSRPLYFAILLTHTVLAAFVAPLVARLLWLAARGNFERHRALARWTLPMWLYVSVTGVLIYLLLYVWFPGP